MATPLWAALMLGIGGSLHCVSMCGPLVMAFGSQQRVWWSPVVYHGARIAAYVLIGFVIGMIGWGLSFVLLQRVLSVGAGVLLIVLLLVQLKVLPAPPAYRWIERRVKAAYSVAQSAQGWSLPLFGFLNGLLPCGLVYVAAAATLNATSWSSGALWMLVFGLGTLPALLVLGALPRWAVAQRMIRQGNRWMPYLGIVLACWMIVRGIGLGSAPAQPAEATPAMVQPYRCPLCK